MNLQEYCTRYKGLADLSQVGQNLTSQPTAQSGSTQPSTSATAWDSPFWRSFERTATPDALAFANTLNPSDVIVYSKTICSFLETNTLPDLRQIQADNQLPDDFERAVTLAAVTTYCPSYQPQVSRQ